MNPGRRPGALALILAACLAASGGPAAAASLSFVRNATTSNLALSYSPDATVQASGTVTVKKGSFAGGAFCVVLTLTSLTQGSPEGLSYAMYAPAASLANRLSLDGSPTSPSQVLQGSFAATDSSKATLSLDYAFVVDPSTLPPPGSYVATINESLYASTYLPSGPVLASNTLKVTVSVGADYDVSVVPRGSSFSLASTAQALNFGSLSPGESLGADILVRSNVSYSLLLSSANLGSLVNPADPTSLVAYSFTSQGAVLGLASGPAAVASGAAATYSTPARYAVDATILPFSGFPSAGSYSDTITITLSSP